MLVTGAASGLGLALVRQLVEAGDTVLATDRASERPAVLPGRAAYRRLDVTSEADWADAIDWVRAEWGGLDLLVNNAGVAAAGRFDRLGEEDWSWIVEVNLLGVVRGARAVMPLLKEQRSGHLVNVASAAGLVHGPGMSSYNVTKAGVVALSETLVGELAPWGIDVSVVCPAFFRTGLAASFPGTDPELERQGTRMLDSARRSADLVAARVLRGIDARREVILVDLEGRLAWYAKRWARPLYLAELRRQGRGMAARLAKADLKKSTD
ncbi:MAG TPA: SDR family NAD(P)-dependent oxidoreductase [Dermatophilaceae bacterium]|nr:SDR family NAD(P)-dependent oxidoreductase [Dermatophilaceae bacterium]